MLCYATTLYNVMYIHSRFPLEFLFYIAQLPSNYMPTLLIYNLKIKQKTLMYALIYETVFNIPIQLLINSEGNFYVIHMILPIFEKNLKTNLKILLV